MVGAPQWQYRLHRRRHRRPALMQSWSESAAGATRPACAQLRDLAECAPSRLYTPHTLPHPAPLHLPLVPGQIRAVCLALPRLLHFWPVHLHACASAHAAFSIMLWHRSRPYYHPHHVRFGCRSVPAASATWCGTPLEAPVSSLGVATSTYYLCDPESHDALCPNHLTLKRKP